MKETIKNINESIILGNKEDAIRAIESLDDITMDQDIEIEEHPAYALFKSDMLSIEDAKEILDSIIKKKLLIKAMPRDDRKNILHIISNMPKEQHINYVAVNDANKTDRSEYISAIVSGIVKRFPEMASSHDVAGNTALQYAIDRDNEAIYGAMISAKSDLLTEYTYNASIGKMSLFMYILRHHHEEVGKIFKYADVNLSKKLSIDDLKSLAKNTKATRSIAKALLESGKREELLALQDRIADVIRRSKIITVSSYDEAINMIRELHNPYMINIKLSNGLEYNMLAQAAIDGRADAIMEALNYGASGSTITSSDSTLLILAAEKGHLEVVKVLLQNGAEVDRPSKGGNTALMWAAKNGHLEVVKVLLEKNAEVNRPNQAGDTALIWAAMNGHLNVVKALIAKNAEINIHGKDRNTALICAAMNGHLNVVNALLEKNVEVNKANEHGETALTLAASNRNLAIVKVLLQNGAEVNITNKNGYTPLTLAIHRRHTNTVTAVLAYSKEIVISEGMYSNNDQIDKLLKETGCTEKGKVNPILYAASKGNIDTVITLIKEGAKIYFDLDLHKIDSLFTLLIQQNEYEYIQKLAERMDEKNPGEKLIKLAIEGNTQEARTLLMSGGIEDKYKYIALKVAVGYCNFDIAKSLLANGANPNYNPESLTIDIATHISNRKTYKEDAREITKLLLINGSELPKHANNCSDIIASYKKLEKQLISKMPRIMSEIERTTDIDVTPPSAPEYDESNSSIYPEASAPTTEELEKK